MIKSVHKQTFFITGGAGSIAKMFIRTLFLTHPTCKIIALDNDDTDLYRLEQEYKKTHLDLTIVLADILDTEILSQLMESYQPDMIIHTAAHKQVSLLESFPERAFKVNTLASINLFLLAKAASIPLIFLSSDKSVEPIGVLGITKWLAECAFISMDIKGCILRLPNVWQTKGSFFSDFLELHTQLGFIPLTHSECERFIMTEGELSKLFTELLNQIDAYNSTVIVPNRVTKINVYQFLLHEISKLNLSSEEINIVGLRPGEKVLEKLNWDSEYGTQTNTMMIYDGTPLTWKSFNFLHHIEPKTSKINQDTLLNEYVNLLRKRVLLNHHE